MALSGVCLAASGPSEGAVKSAKKQKKHAAAEAQQAQRCEACEAIDQLKEQLKAQQAQMQAQQAEIEQLKAAQAPQPAAADEQARAQAAAAKQAADEAAAASAKNDEVVKSLQSQMADLSTATTTLASSAQEDQKRASVFGDFVGRFRFGGDVRVRYENFFQDVNGFHPRHRERIRARLGVEGKLSEDFTGGVYLATGALTDPTSTNETLTNAFERKTVGWDRGWITFQPHNAKWLQLTGGKFAYTWIRTPNTFDNDLNPEGFSEKFSFDVKNKVVRNVTLTGMQLFFNESSSGADSFAVGGQFSTKLQLGKRITTTPSLSVLNWRNANTLVNNSPIAGASGGTFAPNGMTNATIGVAPARTFASKFLYADAILDTSINTGLDRFPVRLLLEYEENLNAASDHSHLYLGDLSVGRLKEKNDVQVGYGLWRQEQDSVIATFVESDQRAPTNVFQHRLFAQWLVRKNTTAAYTFWFGRTLDSNLQNAILTSGVTPGTREPLLRRMQFDLIYKF